MKAAVLTGHGGPEKFNYTDVPDPVAGPEQRVKQGIVMDARQRVDRIDSVSAERGNGRLGRRHAHAGRGRGFVALRRDCHGGSDFGKTRRVCRSR